MKLLALLVSALALVQVGADMCDEMFNKEQCADSVFEEAVAMVTSEKTNKIVAEGVLEALDGVMSTPDAVSYAAPPHWLCDSEIIKKIAGATFSEGIFEYGDTCEKVTDNIRQLVKYTKQKEIETHKKAEATNKNLLATNAQMVKDVQSRNRATQLRNNAQHQVNVVRNRISGKQNEINRLNGEIRRLQDQINRDRRDIIKVIMGLIAGLLGQRDNRQRDVNNKRNEVNRMNNELRSFQNQYNSYQSQVNSWNNQINALKVKIAQADKEIQFLGAQLTKLRNIEKELQVIAMEWSELDEGCEDVEEDLLLFEDLTLAVQTKVEEQATKLSALICGNKVG